MLHILQACCGPVLCSCTFLHAFPGCWISAALRTQTLASGMHGPHATKHVLFVTLCDPSHAAQAVALLSGLEAIPSGEGFHFRHEASGYTFQLAPAPASPGSSAESMRQAELAYLPIRLGAAAQVRKTRAATRVPLAGQQRDSRSLCSWVPYTTWVHCM